MPVYREYFPLRKGSFWIFFTVKHIFHKIKLWPAQTGRVWKKGKDFGYEKA